MTTIGEILKRFRMLQEEEISTTKLSEVIGYSQPYISQIENNTRKPTDEFLKKISEVYNVPIKEFYRILEISNKQKLHPEEISYLVLYTCIKYRNEKDENIKIGDIIRIFRIVEDEMRIAKLAEKVGCTHTYICKIESGEKIPSKEFLKKVSVVFEVPIEEFYRILCVANEKGYDKPRLFLEIVETSLKYEKEGN